MPWISFARLPIGLSLLVALIWGAAISADTVRRDLIFTSIATEISFWSRPPYHPEETARARVERDLRNLLTRSPYNPDYLRLEARRLGFESIWLEDLVLSEDAANAAVDVQIQAQSARPALRQGWINVLQYAQRVSGRERVEHAVTAQLDRLSK